MAERDRGVIAILRALGATRRLGKGGGGTALHVSRARAAGDSSAVALPAGTHKIVFRYRPLAFYAGAAISGAALLLMLLLWHGGEPIRVGRRA